MTEPHTNCGFAPRYRTVCAVAVAALLTACAAQTTDPLGELAPTEPGVDVSRSATTSGLDVGAQLMAAGEYELAIDAFNRAAVEEGISPDVLVALGGANLGLGRLGQAEDLFRRAVDLDDRWPEPWNNLGVVMMERNQHARAVQMFRRAYALDGGDSDVIRANLQLAETRLAEAVPVDNPSTLLVVRQGKGNVRLSRPGEEPALPEPAWRLAETGRTAPGRPVLPGADSAPEVATGVLSDLSLPVLTSARIEPSVE